MKRIFAFTAALLMIALSAGCGRKADADSVGGDAVPDGGSTLEAVSGEAYELTHRDGTN